MRRYCETPSGKIDPCLVGWGAYSNLNSTKSCHDEPIEENCRRIVQEDGVQLCPSCGRELDERP